MRQPRWPPAAGAERGRTDEVDRADCAAHPGLPSIPREAAAHSIKTRPASQKGSIDRSDALRKRRKECSSHAPDVRCAPCLPLLSAARSEDVERHEQDEGQDGGDQQGAEAAQAAGEEEEHHSAVPRGPDVEPGGLCALSPRSAALHPFRGCRRARLTTYGHHRSGRVAGHSRLPPGRGIFRRRTTRRVEPRPG